MRENTTSPPAESSKPIATNQELSTAALLDNMLQAQVATNILLQKILAHQAEYVEGWLRRIWYLILIVVIAVAIFGIKFSVQMSPHF